MDNIELFEKLFDVFYDCDSETLTESQIGDFLTNLEEKGLTITEKGELENREKQIMELQDEIETLNEKLRAK